MKYKELTFQNTLSLIIINHTAFTKQEILASFRTTPTIDTKGWNVGYHDLHFVILLKFRKCSEWSWIILCFYGELVQSKYEVGPV